ncbi:MAG: hypothetical protein OHK0029_06260 [Armatimonadaceae bacterium]
MDFRSNWNEAVGLWKQSGGHTRPVAERTEVHAAPAAARYLLMAAEHNRTGEVATERVLQNLRTMQVTDHGAKHGCLRWYWEEDEPVDTNAAFFVALSLIPLHARYTDRLTETERHLLEAILDDLQIWFAAQCRHRAEYYPNKYLGDLVCGWLLTEATDRQEADGDAIAQRMREAAAYWRQNGWGWGEHLADIYATVCLNELSLLLLLAKRLPEDVHETYYSLFAELLALDDAFGGEPRVPAIRSYAFQQPPRHQRFRDAIPRELPDSDTALPQPGGVHGAILARLYCELGWHRLAPAPQPPVTPQTDIRISCFGGAEAVAHCLPDVRVGSLTRFPLMPSADHPTWGLSWQTFPVALWRPDGDWAFLQWSVTEGGQERCHPAENKKTAYLANTLTPSVNPPITGRTFARQVGGNVLVLRLFPAIPGAAEQIADRLRVVQPSPDWQEGNGGSDWYERLLRTDKRTIQVACVPLPLGTIAPVVRSYPQGTDWQVIRDRSALDGMRLFVTLWAISLDGAIDSEPEWHEPDLPPVPRAPEERAYDLTWRWQSHTWKVRIDPLAPEPLTAIE